MGKAKRSALAARRRSSGSHCGSGAQCGRFLLSAPQVVAMQRELYAGFSQPSFQQRPA